MLNSSPAIVCDLAVPQSARFSAVLVHIPGMVRVNTLPISRTVLYCSCVMLHSSSAGWRDRLRSRHPAAGRICCGAGSCSWQGGVNSFPLSRTVVYFSCAMLHSSSAIVCDLAIEQPVGFAVVLVHVTGKVRINSLSLCRTVLLLHVTKR